jgi:peptide/nickel transport system permease protein
MVPLFLFGIFGPLLYLHNPSIPNLDNALQPPAWVAGGDWSYPLGTDELGRDLLSRIIMGARASLIVAIFGVLFAGLIGVVLGMLAGFLGGIVDHVIMRIVDTWMAIPQIFFMLMLIAVLRKAGIMGLTPIIVSIAVSMWVPYARMIRGETLSLKQRDFIALAKVTGVSNTRIMFKHIFPNVMNTLVVMATTQLGGAIMAEAGMSFLGVGVQPPATAWGSMISESNKFLASGVWWIPTFPGVAITITILGSNLFGDWLRDALDPRTRQTLK